jgi:hypothetical protein
MEEYMLEYGTNNDRTSKLRIKGRCRNITVLSVHATMEEKEEKEEKEERKVL